MTERHQSLLADLLLPELAKIIVEYLKGTLAYVGKWGNRPPGWEEDYLRCKEKRERRHILKKYPAGIHCPHGILLSSKGIIVCDLPRGRHRMRIFRYDGSLLEDQQPPRNAWDITTCTQVPISNTAVVYNNVSEDIRIIGGFPYLLGENDITCDWRKVAFLPNDRVAVCVKNGISIFDKAGLVYDLLDRVDELPELGQQIKPVAITATGNTLYVAGSGGFYIHIFQIW